MSIGNIAVVLRWTPSKSMNAGREHISAIINNPGEPQRTLEEPIKEVGLGSYSIMVKLGAAVTWMVYTEQNGLRVASEVNSFVVADTHRIPPASNLFADIQGASRFSFPLSGVLSSVVPVEGTAASVPPEVVQVATAVSEVATETPGVDVPLVQPLVESSEVSTSGGSGSPVTPAVEPDIKSESPAGGDPMVVAPQRRAGRKQKTP